VPLIIYTSRTGGPELPRARKLERPHAATRARRSTRSPQADRSSREPAGYSTTGQLVKHALGAN